MPDGDLRRMLDTARALAERTALSASAEKVCVEAVGALSQAGDDLPFGLIYLFEHLTGTARLAGSWGEVPDAVGAPATIPLATLDAGAWPDGALRLVSKGPAFSTRTVRMPTKAALVLYTDGLVEIKNRMLDNGLDLLRAALRGKFSTAEEICDRALAAMEIDDDTQDDTTLLVLQRI